MSPKSYTMGTFATGTRVTAEDIAEGNDGQVEIKDNYVLITDGECQVTHMQRHANGTHVITIKGVKP
jgi:hypothetical protein